jgi:hypothetical protein
MSDPIATFTVPLPASLPSPNSRMGCDVAIARAFGVSNGD